MSTMPMKNKVKVFHSTSKSGIKNISASGYLSRQSWVTPDERVKNMSPRDRVKALNLGEDKKGGCLCETLVRSSELAVPSEGPFTRGGYRQFRVRRAIPAKDLYCKCDNTVWFWLIIGATISFVLLGAGVAWWFNRKKDLTKTVEAKNCSNSL